MIRFHDLPANDELTKGEVDDACRILALVTQADNKLMELS